MKEELEELKRLFKEVVQQKVEVASISTVTQLRDSFAQDFEDGIPLTTSPPKIGTSESQKNEDDEDSGNEQDDRTVKFEQKKR